MILDERLTVGGENPEKSYYFHSWDVRPFCAIQVRRFLFFGPVGIRGFGIQTFYRKIVLSCSESNFIFHSFFSRHRT